MILTFEDGSTIDVTDAYGCQQFIKGTVGFTNKDLGMDNRRVNIYVNPWDASFQVGADEIQYRTALGKECDGTKTLEKPSYLFVNGIQFLLKDIRHDLDSNLNLSVSRDFQVDLDAGVINNSSLHGPRDGSERLRDAQYLVRMVLTEDPDLTKNPRFITASDNIVESSSGKITIPRAAFKFINLLDMANRNRILFQILPVDRTKTTIATVKTSNNEDMKIMVPNAGLHYDDVIDHSTRLLPLIYDAKIILMGSDITRIQNV